MKAMLYGNRRLLSFPKNYEYTHNITSITFFLTNVPNTSNLSDFNQCTHSCKSTTLYWVPVDYASLAKLLYISPPFYCKLV